MACHTRRTLLHLSEFVGERLLYGVHAGYKILRRCRNLYINLIVRRHTAHLPGSALSKSRPSAMDAMGCSGTS